MRVISLILDFPQPKPEKSIVDIKFKRMSEWDEIKETLSTSFRCEGLPIMN